MVRGLRNFLKESTTMVGQWNIFSPEKSKTDFIFEKNRSLFYRQKGLFWYIVPYRSNNIKQNSSKSSSVNNKTETKIYFASASENK